MSYRECDRKGTLMIYYNGDQNYQGIKLAYAKKLANVQKVSGKLNAKLVRRLC